MALRNMGHQDKEVRRSLDDVEKLRLYAKATAFEHRALEESLGKASSRSRYCEWKARKGSEKTADAEKERDEAKEEAQVARLVAITVGDVREKMEVTWLGSKMLWRLRRKLGWKQKRLGVRTSLRLIGRLSCYSLGQSRTRCLLSSLKPIRTRRPGRRNIIRLWR